MKKKSRRGSSRGGSFPSFLFPLLALVLILPALSAWSGLVRLVRPLSSDWRVLAPALVGAGVYGIVHLLFRKPMTLYVFGHELTHAAAAVLSGYKIQSLYVSEKGGEVKLSNTNVLVALAPYCVPLYTSLVLMVYALVRWYARLASPPLWALFFVGLTLAFHVSLTVYALAQSQPDLRLAGVFFSLVAILFSNAIVSAIALKTLFPSAVSLSRYFSGMVGDIYFLAEKGWDSLRSLLSLTPQAITWGRSLL